MGKQIRINNHLFTVVGISPKGFTGTTALISPELFVPLGAFGLVMNDFEGAVKPLAARDNNTLIAIGRLKPGMTQQSADAALAVVASQMEKAYPGENKDQTMIVRPLSRMSISTNPTDDSSLRVPAIIAAIAGRDRSSDCIAESSEHDDGQGSGAAQGNRDSAGDWRRPAAHRAAAGYRGSDSGDFRRHWQDCSSLRGAHRC